MRSQSDYIFTKDDVHGYASHWLGTALKLEYEGTKCNTGTLLQILLIAASRVASIFAVCRDLADAPSDQAVRNALAGNCGIGATAESLALYQLAQGLVSQVSQNCHRSHADSLSWPTASRQERNLSLLAKIGHDTFSRLCHGGGGPQGASLHAGFDACRVRRKDETDRAVEETSAIPRTDHIASNRSGE